MGIHSTSMGCSHHPIYALPIDVRNREAKAYVLLYAIMIAYIAQRNTSGTDVTCMVWASTLLIWRQSRIGTCLNPNATSQGLYPIVWSFVPFWERLIRWKAICAPKKPCTMS